VVVEELLAELVALEIHQLLRHLRETMVERVMLELPAPTTLPEVAVEHRLME
jgi:hypothetical protein